MYVQNEVNLHEFTTTEDDKKKGVCKMPKTDPEVTNKNSIRVYYI